MTSLSLISHHLFVAALRNEGGARVDFAQDETPEPEAASRASVITLELLEETKPMGPNPRRARRTAAGPNEA